MSWKDAQDRVSYLFHHVIADLVGGTVEPFDVYQGPYVALPRGGRIWIDQDGMFVRVVHERYVGDPEPVVSEKILLASSEEVSAALGEIAKKLIEGGSVK